MNDVRGNTRSPSDRPRNARVRINFIWEVPRWTRFRNRTPSHSPDSTRKKKKLETHRATIKRRIFLTLSSPPRLTLLWWRRYSRESIRWPTLRSFFMPEKSTLGRLRAGGTSINRGCSNLRRARGTMGVVCSCNIEIPSSFDGCSNEVVLTWEYCS